ncbi:MAG: hypothetical protein WAT43_06185 [Chitinophagales bacterium]|nr:hypothetical protein [Bacteroidota bacterium]
MKGKTVMIQEKLRVICDRKTWFPMIIINTIFKKHLVKPNAGKCFEG